MLASRLSLARPGLIISSHSVTLLHSVARSSLRSAPRLPVARFPTRFYSQTHFSNSLPRGYVFTSPLKIKIVARSLIALNVAAFLMWQVARVDYLKTNGHSDKFNFMMENYTDSAENLRAGRWWTVFTSAISHQDPFHLLTNMFMLNFTVVSSLAVGFGVGRVMVVGLGSAIASSYASHLDHSTRSVEGGPANALGASGVVEGWLTALALTIPLAPTQFPLIPVQFPLIVGWGGFTAWDIYRMSRDRSEGSKANSLGMFVGYSAHLGGAAFGAAYWLLRLRPVFGGLNWALIRAWIFRR